MKNANYRKHNDRQLNSSTYHKKDGTPMRAILKREAEAEISEHTESIEAAAESVRGDIECFKMSSLTAIHLNIIDALYKAGLEVSQSNIDAVEMMI